MLEKFDVDSQDVLEKDIYITLRKFWLYGLLKWKGQVNPFQEELTKRSNKYLVKRLTEESITESVSLVREGKGSYVYWNSYCSPDLEMADSSVKNTWNNNSGRMYFEICFDENKFFVTLKSNAYLSSYELISITSFSKSTQIDADDLLNAFVLISQLCNETQGVTDEVINRFCFYSDNDVNPLFVFPIELQGVLKKENGKTDYYLFLLKC